MILIAFYVVAISILILYFTDWLKRRNLEWIVYLLAVATFPAVIFLKVAPFVWSVVDAVNGHMSRIARRPYKQVLMQSPEIGQG